MTKPQAQRRSTRPTKGSPRGNRNVRLNTRDIEDFGYFCKMLNQIQGKEPKHKGFFYSSPEKKAEWEDMERAEWKPALDIITKLCARPAPKGAHRDFTLSGFFFDEYFGKDAVGFLKISGREKPDCTIEGPMAYGSSNYKQHVAFKLWDVVFKRKGYERIRECQKCEKWFVDKSDNKKSLFCSGDCRNKYWTRSRRLEAGHESQPKKRRTRKKGARS